MSEYSKYTKRELIGLLETQEEMIDALRDENRRSVPADEITHLYHELRVHQEELEVQNQELRLMTEAIEHSRHRYATLYDYAPAAFVSLDEHGLIHDLNLTAATLLRSDRTVLTGKPLSVFLKEGYRQTLYDHLKATLASGRKHTVDLALDLRLNHPVFVQLDSIAIKDDVHHKTLAWTCVSDITTRKLAENRVQASETNLTAVFENTQDAIWSIDKRYHVVTFNSAFNALRKLFSQSAGSVAPPESRLSELSSNVQFSYEWKALYDRALAGEQFSVQKEFRLADEPRYFEFSLNPIRTDPALVQGEDVTGVTIFAKDVTAQRKLQLELQAARDRAESVVRSKSTFFAHVSHEIRTPLSAILSYAALIREDAGTSEVGNFAEVIERNTRNILSSVNNILALSKMDWDGFALKREVVDLAPIVAKQVELFSAKALERNVDITFESVLCDENGSRALAYGDKHSIEQTISNLLSNAVKFTNDGSIDVRITDAEDDRVMILVKDSGPGISPEFQPHIFQEYKQEDTRNVSGSGLGLAITKRLVEMMGGEIRLDSELGKGTSFIVLLKKADPERATASHSEANTAR